MAGEVWPVKEVVRLPNRMDGFLSPTAQRILRRLGFTVHSAPSDQPGRLTADQTEFDVAPLPMAGALTSHVAFDSHLAGPVELDDTAGPRFPTVPNLPGLCRIGFHPAARTGHRTVYIGESTSLRRRTSNYRNAVNDRSRQRTSRRIHQAVVKHLAAGGTIEFAIATEVRIGAGRPTCSGGLPAGWPNAAVLEAQTTDGIRVLNIDFEPDSAEPDPEETDYEDAGTDLGPKDDADRA